jgi:uncharacterized membrane protein
MSRGIRDRGSVSVIFAICMVAVVLFISLSVDGGTQIRAAQQANDIAAEAARVGGQMISIPQAIAGNSKTIQTNPPPGCTGNCPLPYQTAVANYIKATEAETGATVTGTPQINPNGTITVTVTVTYPNAVLSMFGFANKDSATGSATAVLVTN